MQMSLKTKEASCQLYDPAVFLKEDWKTISEMYSSRKTAPHLPCLWEDKSLSLLALSSKTPSYKLCSGDWPLCRQEVLLLFQGNVLLRLNCVESGVAEQPIDELDMSEQDKLSVWKLTSIWLISQSRVSTSKLISKLYNCNTFAFLTSP